MSPSHKRGRASTHGKQVSDLRGERRVGGFGMTACKGKRGVAFAELGRVVKQRAVSIYTAKMI